MKNIKFVLFLLLISNLVSAQNIEDTAKKSTDITKPFMIKAGYLQTDLYGDHLDTLSVEGETKALNSFMIGFEFHSESAPSHCLFLECLSPTLLLFQVIYQIQTT